MIEFKKIKKIELDVYDLIKRYERTGTKKELLKELREINKDMLKAQQGKPAAAKEIKKALEISKQARRDDNTSWRAGNIAGLEKALRIIKENK
ncbi:hypothetical protein DFR79_13257 [Halanaerobium saccharolyticum]|jgi:hypothetical protein|uniref:Uncharacterized protein n=1 Tax=Halanaerobium saccharolyticum TaxID=43595 RepID=A0A4V3CDN4_9FIRM|nr:hypothetical protein [Halanaerobium saccharolyticum]TDO77725.1 hypothetical protein DFR79_13257 [Halanaerobium saccharolyticum]